MLILILAVVWIVSVPLLLIWALYNTAKNDWQATFVNQGSMKFVVAGGKCVKTLVNIPGKVYTKSGWIKRSPKHPQPDSVEDPKATPDEIEGASWWLTEYLRERWGFYWVSFFYPVKKIHSFFITKERSRSEALTEGKPLSDRIEREEDVEVNELLGRFPRPHYFSAVETKDRFRVDMLGTAIYEVVIPHIPVFTFRGKFFDQLASAVGGRNGDLVKEKTFTELIATDKGEGSNFSKSFQFLNEGLISKFGIRIIAFWIEEVRLSPNQPDVEKATRAMEIAELEGEADIAMAERELTAARLRAKAAGAGIAAIGSSLRKYGPVAHLVTEIETSKNLGQNSNISVLTGKGTNPAIVIDPSKNTRSKAKKANESDVE